MRLESSRGAALVELAISLVLFILFLTGMSNFATVLYDEELYSQAVSASAAIVSTLPPGTAPADATAMAAETLREYLYRAGKPAASFSYSIKAVNSIPTSYEIDPGTGLPTTTVDTTASGVKITIQATTNSFIGVVAAALRRRCAKSFVILRNNITIVDRNFGSTAACE